MNETVNHPKHYNTGKFECIDVMVEVFGIEATQNFCVLNAFKYIYRSDHKGKKTEDIKKAEWYLEEYLKLEKRKAELEADLKKLKADRANHTELPQF